MDRLIFHSSVQLYYIRVQQGRHTGVKQDFFGDVVPGGFSKKTKKWHIHYFESDAESEDLNVRDILSSLHTDE